jgi:hypothetical protein
MPLERDFMLSEKYVRVLADPVGGPHSTVIFLPNPNEKKGRCRMASTLLD